jgi:ABC-type cobalamin/Fe3+-siderophores transport system ATPase subunit
MLSILFTDVGFAYDEANQPVFENLNIELPPGIYSLVGQNGTGKTTFLLLAGARLIPSEGSVTVNGIDTRNLQDETEKNKYVSFVYQNMEFETEEPIGDLLEYVYENGFHQKKNTDFVRDLVAVFELEKLLKSKTQNISKGELQRTILAFSLLYGSKAIMLDEPIFAMEEYQKNKSMDFIKNYAESEGLTVYFSAHELEISRKYSEYILLFSKYQELQVGPTSEIFKKETIEKAYEVPWVMLKRRESLFREAMIKFSDSIKKRGRSQG